MTRAAPVAYRDDLAYVHHVGHGRHAEQAGRELLTFLRRARIRRGTLVDLACGSGIWARLAGEAGFDVVGVDPSPALLRIARDVAPRARFVRESMYRFELPPCDAVTILGEGLNYLGAGTRPPRELFRRVARALRPGGLFAFDVLVDEGPPLDGRKWSAGSDWAVLVDLRDRRARRLLERRITVFRQVGRAYRRSEELHRQRVFRAVDLTRDLESAGFTVELSDRYGRFELLPRRAAFVARAGGRHPGGARRAH